MTFLLTQISVCLLLAFLVGFALGWLFREVFRDRDGASDAYGEPNYQAVAGTSVTPGTRRLRRGRLTTVLGEE